MSCTIYNAKGEVISYGKDLQVMLRYARRIVPVAAIFENAEQPVNGCKTQLTVHYDNGARAVTPYFDWSICAQFLAARRAWPDLAVFGLAEFVKRYCQLRGEAATLRALLADMVSESSRSGSGNPWRMASIKRACQFLTGEPYSLMTTNLTGETGLNKMLSPWEREARAKHYNF